MRKGRFDEMFFVDLPKSDARWIIFRINLEIRELKPDEFDLGILVEASDGFSGAEIEQAVVSALYSAHALSETMNTQHLLHELKSTRPLSITMAEKINTLRDWASERTMPAD